MAIIKIILIEDLLDATFCSMCFSSDLADLNLITLKEINIILFISQVRQSRHRKPK